MRRVLQVAWLTIHPLPFLPDVWDVVMAILILFGASGIAGGAVAAASGAVQGIAGGFAVLFGLLFVFAFVAGFRLQGKVDEYEEQPLPNVVFDGFDDNPAQTQTEQSVDLDTGKVNQRLILAEFRRVRFANYPQQKGGGAEAKQLSARIEFFDQPGSERLLEVRDGRWADVPERWQAGRDIKWVDLPPSGVSATLDIATKGHGEAECYGWSNSGRVGPGLAPGSYQVRVRLAVANLGVDDKYFWFTLINPGKDGFMALTERQGFDNDCSEDWAVVKLAQGKEVPQTRQA